MPTAGTPRSSYRLPPDVREAIADIRAVDLELTGIEPTDTAVICRAILEDRRRRVGLRHADARPVRSRRAT